MRVFLPPPSSLFSSGRKGGREGGVSPIQSTPYFSLFLSSLFIHWPVKRVAGGGEAGRQAGREGSTQRRRFLETGNNGAFVVVVDVVVMLYNSAPRAHFQPQFPIDDHLITFNWHWSRRMAPTMHPIGFLSRDWEDMATLFPGAEWVAAAVVGLSAASRR